ncbi:hypothetical protein CIRG_04663 [Coccidioides immitis RMSCC 2394]|uniref:Uncharacterized protein n=1 Tax=Coccidioides immitis RMSCC 2394 TaxID=404692 RepID=A0A0J6Y8G5_COCIT|nr:hypothetical protein CIRG_04663 [Coccidioides immitis RMSCC 2394]
MGCLSVLFHRPNNLLDRLRHLIMAPSIDVPASRYSLLTIRHSRKVPEYTTMSPGCGAASLWHSVGSQENSMGLSTQYPDGYNGDCVTTRRGSINRARFSDWRRDAPQDDIR